MTERAGAFAAGGMASALRHRNFRLFYAGYAISLIGTWMQTTAMAWLVWRLTHSERQLGLIAFAGQIPNLFLAPWGGVLADRVSRHKLVIFTQALAMSQAAALGCAAIWIRRSGMEVGPALGLLAGLAACLGAINAFDMPVRQAFVVDLVGPEDLPNAIAMNSFIFNTARVLGPMAAGQLGRMVNESSIFLLNAASYLVVIGALAFVRLAPRPPKPPQPGAGRHLVEGIRFAWGHACLRDLLLFVGAISLIGLPAQAMMPAIAGKVFHGDSAHYGNLTSATGLGSLVGALLMMRGLLGNRRETLIVGAGACYGAGLVALSFSTRFWLSAALLAPTGASMMVLLLSTNTSLQNLTPNRLRGRVISLYTMMLLGFVPMGSYVLGQVAERIGPLTAVRAQGICCALAAGLMALRLPAIRASASRVKLERSESASD